MLRCYDDEISPNFRVAVVNWQPQPLKVWGNTRQNGAKQFYCLGTLSLFIASIALLHAVDSFYWLLHDVVQPIVEIQVVVFLAVI